MAKQQETIRIRGKKIDIRPSDYKILLALDMWDGACPVSWIRDPDNHRRVKLDPKLGIELLDVNVASGKPSHRSERYFADCTYVLKAAASNRRARSIVYVNPEHYDKFDDIVRALTKKRKKP